LPVAVVIGQTIASVATRQGTRRLYAPALRAATRVPPPTSPQARPDVCRPFVVVPTRTGGLDVRPV